MKPMLLLLILFSLLSAQIIEQQAILRGDTIRKVITTGGKLKVTQMYVKTDTLDVVEPMTADEKIDLLKGEISLEKIRNTNKTLIKEHQ